MKQRVLSTMLVIFLFILLHGCSNNTEQGNQLAENQYRIYYINKNITKITPEIVEITQSSQEEIVNQMILLLQEDSEHDVDKRQAIPDGARIVDYTIDNTLISVYFSQEYASQDTIREILGRSAIVRTLTQVSGIERVSFYVNEQPLLNTNGKPIGVMRASDVIEDLGGDVNEFEKAELRLYFTDSVGDKLIEEERQVMYNNSVSMERVVVEELIKGTSMEGHFAVIPSDTRILTINTQDGVCYVNLDSAFLTGSVHTTEEVTIYALVNSLIELPNIKKVQIAVNGDSMKKYREVISLENAFERNLDLIATEEELATEESQTETEVTP